LLPFSPPPDFGDELSRRTCDFKEAELIAKHEHTRNLDGKKMKKKERWKKRKKKGKRRRRTKDDTRMQKTEDTATGCVRVRIEGNSLRSRRLISGSRLVAIFT